MKKEKAFEQLFRTDYTKFYHLAQQMIDDCEVCRDIVEDAFEQVWLKYDQIDNAKLANFTYRLVKNKCVDYIRKEIVKSKYVIFYKNVYLDEDDTLRVLDNTEQQLQIMYAVMEELSPKTKYIIEQCFLFDRTYADVADELAISVSAVRKHIVKALKKFRDKIPKKE